MALWIWCILDYTDIEKFFKFFFSEIKKKKNNNNNNNNNNNKDYGPLKNPGERSKAILALLFMVLSHLSRSMNQASVLYILSRTVNERVRAKTIYLKSSPLISNSMVYWFKGFVKRWPELRVVSTIILDKSEPVLLVWKM